jgi:hypothetical protein
LFKLSEFIVARRVGSSRSLLLDSNGGADVSNESDADFLLQKIPQTFIGLAFCLIFTSLANHNMSYMTDKAHYATFNAQFTQRVLAAGSSLQKL